MYRYERRRASDVIVRQGEQVVYRCERRRSNSIRKLTDTRRMEVTRSTQSCF